MIFFEPPHKQCISFIIFFNTKTKSHTSENKKKYIKKNVRIKKKKNAFFSFLRKKSFN